VATHLGCGGVDLREEAVTLGVVVVGPGGVEVAF
jgi:hypothetical protein